MKALLYRILALDTRTSTRMPMGQSRLNQNGSRWEKMIYLTVCPFENVHDRGSLSILYIVASLTKMFTTIVALQQLERGAFGLNDTVVSHLPGFDGERVSMSCGEVDGEFLVVGGKATVTVQMLMTHTSGFDADPDPGLWYGYVA
jgi:hypothetical protein